MVARRKFVAMLLAGVVGWVFAVRGRRGELALLEVLDEGVKVGAREGAAAGAGDLIPLKDVRGQGAGIRIGAAFLRIRKQSYQDSSSSPCGSAATGSGIGP